MPTIGELVVELDARTAKLETALGFAEQRTKKFTESSHLGYRKVETAVTELGLASVGLEGKTGKLAEGMLLLGVGGGVTLAVTAGLKLLSVLMDDASNGAVEYQKHLDDLGKSYLDLADGLEKATRSQILFDRANKEQQLRTVNAQIADPALAVKQLGFFGGLKAVIGGMNSQKGGTWWEALASGLQPARARIYSELAAMDAVLEDFDKKERDREAAKRGKPVFDTFAASLDDLARLWRMHAPEFKQIADLLELSGRGGDSAFNALSKGVDAAYNARNAAFLKDHALKLPDTTKTLDGIQQSVEANAKQLDGLTKTTLDAIDKTVTGRQLKLAAFMEETWKSAAQNIQTALADTFDNLFKGQIKSLADFAKGVVDIIEKTLAQIAAAEAVSGLTPLVQGILGGAAAAGGGSAIPGAPALPPGATAPAMVVQHITYAPTVTAIDAKGVKQFYRETRGALMAEVARAGRESVVTPSIGGR